MRMATGRAMRAQVMPIVGVVIAAMLAMSALAVDLTGAWQAHARQQQLCEFAKDRVMGDLTALKFSTASPASRPWADDVASALAADGYEGDFAVWYYELPESRTGESDRLVVLRVELSRERASVLARVLGHDSTTVSDELTWWANPYSSSTLWRPDGTSGGACVRYEGRIEHGSVTMSGRGASTSELPRSVTDAATDGLANLSGGM